MRNVSKRQQPNYRADNSRNSMSGKVQKKNDIPLQFIL